MEFPDQIPVYVQLQTQFPLDTGFHLFLLKVHTFMYEIYEENSGLNK